MRTRSLVKQNSNCSSILRAFDVLAGFDRALLSSRRRSIDGSDRIRSATLSCSVSASLANGSSRVVSPNGGLDRTMLSKLTLSWPWRRAIAARTPRKRGSRYIPRADRASGRRTPQKTRGEIRPANSSRCYLTYLPVSSIFLASLRSVLQ